MKKYNINVNGTIYAVEVEEVGGAAAPAPVVAAPVAAPTPTVAPAPVVKAAPLAPASAAPAAGAQTITSPMPGTILDIKVTPGQAVKAGDILLILEAMKMENEIMAPDDGTIDTVQVIKGASVNSGDVLITIK